MYSSPDAIKMYAQKVGKSEAIVQLTVKEFYPKDAMSPDRVKDIDKVMAVTKEDVQRVANKYLVPANRTVVITVPKATGRGSMGASNNQ